MISAKSTRNSTQVKHRQCGVACKRLAPHALAAASHVAIKLQEPQVMIDFQCMRNRNGSIGAWHDLRIADSKLLEAVIAREESRNFHATARVHVAGRQVERLEALVVTQRMTEHETRRRLRSRP